MLSVARKIKNNIFTKKIDKKYIINQELPSKKLDKNALKIVKTLQDKGFETYLVGGCVRDILLGLKPKDFDISTNATPKQINKIFKRSRIIGRRFQIVHILFGARDFMEVSTFRGTEDNTKMLKRDNNFGNIQTDALRRDLSINSLYYNPAKAQIIDFTGAFDDIKTKQIKIIGDANLRFNQDPVRILRAIRFSVKLGFKIDKDIKDAIAKNKHLLKNIPAARFFEESLKLFHNTKSHQTFLALENYGVLQYLFPRTKNNDLLKIALDNTSARIKQNQGVSPAFVFAVFLYDDYLHNFEKLKKQIKSNVVASQKASSETIFKQTKFISIPKFVAFKVKNTWEMQSLLLNIENCNPEKIIQKKDFRMAYDFLVMRSQSTETELIKIVNFWSEVQPTQKSKKSNRNYDHSTKYKKANKNLSK